MSSDKREQRDAQAAASAVDESVGDVGHADAGRSRKPRRARRSHEQGTVHSAPDAADVRERLRDGTAEALAATREHIVANPVQAVLIAAAAGAVAALLLGIGRR